AVPAATPALSRPADEAVCTTETQYPEQRPPQRRQRVGRRWLLGAAALLLIGLGVGAWLYGGAIFRGATNKGELVIEVDDADVEVTVKQGGATVIDRKKDRQFVLSAKGGEIEFYDPQT